MTMKSKLAAVAIVAMVGTTASAGNLSDAGTADQDIIIIPDNQVGAAIPRGSLGGRGGVAPILLGLLLVGAVVAGGGT